MAGKRYSRRAGVAYGASKHAVMAVNSCLISKKATMASAPARFVRRSQYRDLDRRLVPVPVADRARLIQPEDIAETVLFVARLIHGYASMKFW